MSSVFDKAFTAVIDECLELYDKDELEKCVEKAQQRVDDAAAPRYHRLRPWILLGSVLKIETRRINAISSLGLCGTSFDAGAVLARMLGRTPRWRSYAVGLGC